MTQSEFVDKIIELAKPLKDFVESQDSLRMTCDIKELHENIKGEKFMMFIDLDVAEKVK